MKAVDQADPGAATAAARAVCGVVVGTEAAVALRRQLGPVAWCALETLVAVSDDGGLAAVSVRSLAVELGVSKNTAQRALAALRAARLVAPAPTRREAGRFAVGAYRVAVSSSVLVRVPVAGVTPSVASVSAGVDTAVAVSAARAVPASSVAVPSGRSRRRSRVRPVVVEQLSLLPEV